MKEVDKQVMATMTTDLLIENIKHAKPDSKDIMRAKDIWAKEPRDPYGRHRLANKQLQAITDTQKFYRRAQAFLSNGIDCSLGNTIFYKCNTIDVKDYMANAQKAGMSLKRIEDALAKL